LTVRGFWEAGMNAEYRAVQQLLSQSDLFDNWLKGRPRNEIVDNPIQRFLAEYERLILASVVIDGVCVDVHGSDGVVTISLPEWAQLFVDVLDEYAGEITAGRCRAALGLPKTGTGGERRPALGECSHEVRNVD
jgi:hypothetical protein